MGLANQRNVSICLGLTTINCIDIVKNPSSLTMDHILFSQEILVLNFNALIIYNILSESENLCIFNQLHQFSIHSGTSDFLSVYCYYLSA